MLSGPAERPDESWSCGPAGAGGGSAPAGRPTSASSDRPGASCVVVSSSRTGSSVRTDPPPARRAASAAPRRSTAAQTIHFASRSLVEAAPERGAVAFRAARAGATAESASDTSAPLAEPWRRRARRSLVARKPALRATGEPVTRRSPRAEPMPRLGRFVARPSATSPAPDSASTGRGRDEPRPGRARPRGIAPGALTAGAPATTCGAEVVTGTSTGGLVSPFSLPRGGAVAPSPTGGAGSSAGAPSPGASAPESGASPGPAEPSPDVSPTGVPSPEAVGCSAGVCPSLTSASPGAEDPSVAPDPSVAGTSAPEPATASSPVSAPSTGATSPTGAEPSLGTDSFGAGVDSTGASYFVSAAGAGTSGEAAGASAGRAARSSSGSRYSCFDSATRTPKCRCGRSTSRSPVIPTAPMRSRADTSSPRFTSISERCRYDVSNCPSAVRIDTIFPREPSEPAYSTLPGVAARTGSPTAPAMSMPRWSPLAYGFALTPYFVRISPSTGHGQSPAAWAAGARERASAVTAAVTTAARMRARRRRRPIAGGGRRM